MRKSTILKNLNIPTIRKFEILTTRELEVINLIVMEYSTKQIADQLCLGAETIKSHKVKIRRKLGVKTVAGIVREAILNDLVTKVDMYKMAG